MNRVTEQERRGWTWPRVWHVPWESNAFCCFWPWPPKLVYQEANDVFWGELSRLGKEKDTYLQFSGTLGNREESLWQCGEKATCRGNGIAHSASLGRLKTCRPACCVYFLPGKRQNRIVIGSALELLWVKLQAYKPRDWGVGLEYLPKRNVGVRNSYWEWQS